MNNLYVLCIISSIINTFYGMENKYQPLDPLVKGYTRVGKAQLPEAFKDDIHFLKNIAYDPKTNKVYVNFPIHETDNKGRRSIIIKIANKNPEATIAFLNTLVLYPKN